MCDNQEIQFHLTIIQAVITRMATNSSGCKTWCITIISALFVLIIDKGKNDYIWITLFPAVLFCVLDIYYLTLEKQFRNSYNEFVAKIHSGSVARSDLYVVKPSGRLSNACFQSLMSFSIWPFYLTILIIIIISMIITHGASSIPIENTTSINTT